jgi:hypothetical protein
LLRSKDEAPINVLLISSEEEIGDRKREEISDRKAIELAGTFVTANPW